MFFVRNLLAERTVIPPLAALAQVSDKYYEQQFIAERSLAWAALGIRSEERRVRWCWRNGPFFGSRYELSKTFNMPVTATAWYLASLAYAEPCRKRRQQLVTKGFLKVSPRDPSFWILVLSKFELQKFFL